MKYELAHPDKRVLIKELERQVGQRAAYSGIPLFQYQVGPYTVLRDGSMEGPADTVTGALVSTGLIAIPAPPSAAPCFPLADLTGCTLANIVCSLHPREDLINRAIGVPDAIRINEDLMQRLRERRPVTVDEFLDIFKACGGNTALKGLRLENGTLIFDGFPHSDAWHTLAEMLVKAASTRKWMTAKLRNGDSEKYAFHKWLETLKMGGPEFSAVRKELMRGLGGYSSHRLEIQYHDYLRRMSEKAEPDFVLL